MGHIMLRLIATGSRPRRETLQQFAERSPSSIPPDIADIVED